MSDFETLQREYQDLERRHKRLLTSFRLNAKRWAPELSERQIEAEIKRIEGHGLSNPS